MAEFNIENLNIYAAMSKGVKNIVKDLSFSVKPGQPLAIVGESGSGKTMTALSVLKLLPQNCRAVGSVRLDSEELLIKKEREINKLRGDKIVYIPQNGADFLNPSLKIRTQIYESLKKNGIKGKRELYAAACEALESVGLDEKDVILNKYPFQVSGGQAQRVVLAISLANAELVIADEPTKGIDAATAEKFLDKLDELFSDACVIVITHNISVAARCKKTLVMKAGEAVEYGDSDQVLKDPQNEYTKTLLASLPQNWKRDAETAAGATRKQSGQC